MKKIAFITMPDAEFGFGLAGVNQYVAEHGHALETLNEAISHPTTGLVIIDERLLRDIGEENMRAMEKRWDGILLVLPSPGRPVEEAEDYLSRLIRRAIGYHVRFKI